MRLFQGRLLFLLLCLALCDCQEFLPKHLDEPRLETSTTHETAERVAILTKQIHDWMETQHNIFSQGAKEKDDTKLVSVKQWAKERRDAMLSLIQNDPKAALGLAMTTSERMTLPPTIQSEFEQWFDTHGNFLVLLEDRFDDTGSTTRRYIDMFDKRFLASVYGQHLELTSKQNIPLQGIFLDNWVAVDDDESVAPTLFENASDWTLGEKKLLVMRVDFPDLQGYPLEILSTTNFLTDDKVKSLINSVNTFFKEMSYGKTFFAPTFTPLLRLPKNHHQPSPPLICDESHPENCSYAELGPQQLLDDARVKAKELGFDTATYELDIVYFSQFQNTSKWNFAGLASVGGKDAWVQAQWQANVTAHELGHNYGLPHADSWQTKDNSMIGPGNYKEYGNYFDTMGGKVSFDHFNVFFKSYLKWLPDAQIQTISKSGIYEVYPADVTIAVGNQALKISRNDGDKTYWLEMRKRTSSLSYPLSSNPWIENGVVITRQYGRRISEIIDTHPGTYWDIDDYDRPLVVGETFSDPMAGIHITPLEKINTNPPRLKILFELGHFKENHPPNFTLTTSTKTTTVNTPVTFSANVFDEDHDDLSYAWNFGDYTLSNQPPPVEKSWKAAGKYKVELVVSDRKGGKYRDALQVLVGAEPPVYQLTGTIVDAAGRPLENVRVAIATDPGRIFIFPDAIAASSSRGIYTLSNLPAQTYKSFVASALDYVLEANFTLPVVVNNHLSSLNFTAKPTNLHAIRGHVMFNQTPIAGVEISDGTRQATTDATGAYVITDVPTARYCLSASKPGWRFQHVKKTTTDVFGEDTTQDFSVIGIRIAGEIIGATEPVEISDGTRTATSVNVNSRFYYNLYGVPRGRFTLEAKHQSYKIAPQNFSNPVEITNDVELLSINFVASRN